ncbi:histidine phosphatase family protein [Nocardioides sp. KIGAM211]|uniref:Histidine phosphatase family protein n=1 Tax=Nocardioides luti TaxID=2761101 RepID=A0A7X0RL90_9ACTN|nr:histidine phosphatase family protein [Nocardioides luti]MBB6629285.1 histidine phosphatase family protein [Nocardioides luti]
MSAERRLVLLRHGRTAWNHALRIQGQADAELDDTGQAEAAATAPVIAALRPSVLWSSDLARTRQTAAYVAKETGLEPTYDARLREFALGEREGLTHPEYAELAPDEFALFRRGDFDAVLGGERTSAVRERMVAVAHDLLDTLAPGELAVAVSHGAAIRVAVAGLLGWPDDALHSLHGLANCGWVELGLREGDRLRLTAYNRVVGV